MGGGDPEPSKRRPVMAVWHGGVDGGNPPELLEVNIPYPYGAVVDWMVDRINGLEGRVKELEGRVAALEREIRGPKEKVKGGGESMSNVDQVLRECISSNVIYACPWISVNGIYCIPTNDSSFLGKLSDKLKGVGNIDDVAVKTSDGSVVCYIYVDGTSLKALREAGVLEGMKERLKQQYAECCMYHMHH